MAPKMPHIPLLASRIPILTILGDMIRNEVCDEVKEVKLFSILVEETKDLSKQEQMSIVVRYVNSASRTFSNLHPSSQTHS